MIAVELNAVVIDNPTPGYSLEATRPVPERYVAGSSEWERIRYLPQLALVLLEHRAGYRSLVPIGHVWYMMAAEVGTDLLGELAAVIA